MSSILPDSYHHDTVASTVSSQDQQQYNSWDVTSYDKWKQFIIPCP